MNSKSNGRKASRARVAKLEQELAATKEYLQSVIESREATNEELQSANEELATVNDELRNRNLEITQVNNDLTNLFASFEVAVIMVGGDLTIRSFTPEAQKFFDLIPADIGRSLLNINPTVEIPGFQQLVLQVISNYRPVEKALSDAQGARFLLKILPYHTSENRIDGVVITIIARLKGAREANAHRAPSRADQFVGGPNEPSPREMQVVRFLAEGKSNKEIAYFLSLSTRTVETYRSRLMAKLKVHSAAQIVRYAIRHNLIEA